MVRFMCTHTQADDYQQTDTLKGPEAEGTRVYLLKYLLLLREEMFYVYV